MASLRPTCGKTTVVKSTPSHTRRAGSKGALCSSALASTLLPPQCQPSWKRERSSSHSSMICTSFADRRGLEPSTLFWRQLWDHSRISVHVGKTKVWNPVFPFCVCCTAECCRVGSPHRHCVARRFGTPHTPTGVQGSQRTSGHPDFAQRLSEGKIAEHRVLLNP